MSSVLEFFDLFDKNNVEEMKSHSKSGPIISSILVFFSLVLFFGQFLHFIYPEIYRDLSVDPSFSNGHEMVNISLSILVDMPCFFLHLDTVDDLGFMELNVNSTVTFRRLAPNNSVIGTSHFTMRDVCGSCYNLSDKFECCSCQQLHYLSQVQNITATPEKWAQCENKTRPTIYMKEKCLVKGKLTVNKVRGSFHIAPGINARNNAFRHLMGPEIYQLSMSHRIDRIRFGPHIPRTSNPLKNINYRVQFPFITYYYCCIVTPVKFIKGGKEVKNGYEYTVFSMFRPTSPMIYFDYKFTPYTIVVTMNPRSPLSFISSTFGVIAGIYAFATILEELLQVGVSPKAQ